MENPDEKGMAQRLCRDEKEGPLEQILEQEHAVHLWKLVERLDIKYRTVILLYYYNELSTREIAKITGTLEGTVKSRLFQARKLLKKQLESEERRICFEGKPG